MNCRPFVAGLVLLVPAISFGQQATSDTAADAALMEGPKVDARNAPKTLVARSFDGKLTVIEDRPEFAAVALLEIDESLLAAYTTLREDRAIAVNSLLRDEYELFLNLQGLRQSSADPAKMRPLMFQFREAAGGLVDPPLKEQVAAVLPEEQRAEYLAIVQEYLEALRTDYPAGREARADKDVTPAESAEMNAAADGEKRKNRREVPAAFREQRAEVVLLLREVAQSLGALVQASRERGDELMKAIEATPEQDAAIRVILQEKAGLGQKPTKANRAELFQAIAAELTTEQRRKLVQYLRNN